MSVLNYGTQFFRGLTNKPNRASGKSLDYFLVSINETTMITGKKTSSVLRYSWVILFVLWALHLALSVRDFFPSLQDVCLCLPGGQTPILSSTGTTWAQLASTNPRLATFLASTLVDDGISGVGLAIFGMIVSATDYRKGEKWAWYASWTMPTGILAAQLNIYLLTASTMILVLAIIFTAVSLAAMFLPLRQFFPNNSR